jgi:hypothetical protein
MGFEAWEAHHAEASLLEELPQPREGRGLAAARTAGQDELLHALGAAHVRVDHRASLPF